MKKITVSGGIPLRGTVAVSGSKNAALPILFATLVTGGISRLSGVPDIGDVDCAIRILECYGAHIRRDGGILTVDTRDVSYATPPDSLISSIRASTYLIGAGLARFGRADVRPFGGCAFSHRPIDIHLDACRDLGATVDGDRILCDRLHGGSICLRLPSVGATVNALLMSVAAAGESTIHGYAREPHIDDLIRFLRAAGASITVTPDAISVKPAPLRGARHHLVGDMIEAGSYLVAAVATGGSVSLSDPPADSLAAITSAISSTGAKIKKSRYGLSATAEGRLHPSNILATPYPGFPTDLAPIMTPLFSLSGGSVTDSVWPSRFGYLDALSHFGLRYRLTDNRAEIFPSRLTPARVSAPDLRGGMACVIAALMADGRSEIYSAEHILRGYENLTEKLTSLGAHIEITDAEA